MSGAGSSWGGPGRCLPPDLAGLVASARHTREVLTATDQMFGHPNDRSSELSVELVWPSGVRRDASLPLLVYLDLNHWVGLAKAATGHRDGARYQTLLEACRTVRQASAALFPLSATHYMEVAKIADARRRADLAGILEELSGFHTLLARSAIVELEFDLRRRGSGLAWADGDAELVERELHVGARLQPERDPGAAGHLEARQRQMPGRDRLPTAAGQRAGALRTDPDRI